MKRINYSYSSIIIIKEANIIIKFCRIDVCMIRTEPLLRVLKRVITVVQMYTS